MKKVVLIGLVALAAVACKEKVAPIEMPAPGVIDSIAIVEGQGEVVTDVFGQEIAASEGVNAQSTIMDLHHQALAKNGVYEMRITTVGTDGKSNLTHETGRFNVVEGGEFPIYELKKFGENTATFFWALKGDTLEMLDANKLPLATPYTLLRVAVAPAEVAEVEAEAAPAEEAAVEAAATEETAA